MAGIKFGDDNLENQKRLEKWLKSFEEVSREVITTIAHRVAMRSAPVLAELPIRFAEEVWGEPLTLNSMRCLMISSVVCIWPGEDIRSAARSALSAALSAARSADSALSAADSALSAADSALSAAISAARSARSAADSAFSAAAIWESVRRDIAFIEEGGDAKALLAQPMWITDGHETFEDYGWSADDRAKVEAFGRIDEWSFWGKWLLESYEGRKRSDREWEMLREIGLIDDAIWKEGEGVKGVQLEPAAAIARRIKGEDEKQDTPDPINDAFGRLPVQIQKKVESKVEALLLRPVSTAHEARAVSNSLWKELNNIQQIMGDEEPPKVLVELDLMASVYESVAMLIASNKTFADSEISSLKNQISTLLEICNNLVDQLEDGDKSWLKKLIANPLLHIAIGGLWSAYLVADNPFIRDLEEAPKNVTQEVQAICELMSGNWDREAFQVEGNLRMAFTQNTPPQVNKTE